MVQVYTFYIHYMKSDSDWQWACEVVGINPYDTWTDYQWEYWNILVEY